jgi:predicted metalloprotease with PDZ domain
MKNSKSLLLVAILLLVDCVSSQATSQHSPSYKIFVDKNDLKRVGVEIRTSTNKPTVRLAMAAHPEYDDRYFRYVEDFSAESGGRKLAVSKPEDAIWLISGVRGELTVRYKVRLAPEERAWRQTWKPYLTPKGGMVGDLHTLMYVVGEEKRQAGLTLVLPAGWKAVSGLKSTEDPNSFTGSVELLLDSPVMIGDLKEWKFEAGGIPHTVAIWSHSDAMPVDAAPIVEGIQKLVDQAIRAFGKPPYPRYTFLLENGGQAALEHATSVNIGVAREISDIFETIGHEYVHVWNLMDVRPKERVGLRYKFAEPTGVLWWSEGATIYFSDLLIRRAGIDKTRRSRLQRLESLISRYLSSPGYSTLSAELVSRGDSHPELLTNEWAGTHLQGEVLVSMLDLLIRDAADGAKSVDDVMHALAAEFDSTRGVDNADIERSTAGVCRCEVRDFFKDHIYSAKQVDFDRYLSTVGLKAETKWTTALDNEGKPSVDMLVGPVAPEGQMRLRVTNSKSAWATAGLRTGDKTISAGGKSVRTWQEFRGWLRTLKVGDIAKLTIERAGKTRSFEVLIKPFDIPTVRITEIANANGKQIRLRDAWINAR